MLKKLLVLTMLVGIASTTTLAQFAPGVRGHQERQKERIAQGMRNGKVSPSEAIKLEQEQARIHQDKRAARSDGQMTKAERTNIRQEQHQANRDIYQYKHNYNRR